MLRQKVMMPTRLAELIGEYNEDHPETPMTQVRLGGLVGQSPMTVHRHITGKTAMTLLQAAAYAKALGVKVEELVPAGEPA